MSRFGASWVVSWQRFPTPGAVPGLWALALALASGAPPASAQAVQWRPDYGAARREAAAHEQPLVLVVSAASCPWCRQMERTTLRDPEVVGVLNRRFVPVKVAADDARNGSLVSGLGLQGLPAVVLVAPGGQVLTTREGFLDAAGFLALLASLRPPAAAGGRREAPPLPCPAGRERPRAHRPARSGAAARSARPTTLRRTGADSPAQAAGSRSISLTGKASADGRVRSFPANLRRASSRA